MLSSHRLGGRMRRVFLLIVVLCSPAAVAAEVWAVAAGPDAASVAQVYPGAAGELLVLGGAGQIYATSDWGQSWVRQDEADRWTYDIAYGHGTFYRLLDTTILKSTDGGRTWTALASGLPAGVEAWDGLRPVEIAADDDGLYLRRTETLYRQDVGATDWTVLTTIPPSGQIAPSDGGVVDALPRGFLATGDALFATLGFEGLAVSRDRGATFTSALAPGALPLDEFIGGILAMDGTGAKLVTQGDSGLWSSTDAGVTWTLLVTDLPRWFTTAGYLADGRLVAFARTHGLYTLGIGNQLDPGGLIWDSLDLAAAPLSVSGIAAASGRNIVASPGLGIAIGAGTALDSVRFGFGDSRVLFTGRGGTGSSGRIIAIDRTYGGEPWSAASMDDPWTPIFADLRQDLRYLLPDGQEYWGVEQVRDNAGSMSVVLARLDAGGAVLRYASTPVGWADLFLLFDGRTSLRMLDGVLWAIGDAGLYASTDTGMTWQLRLAMDWPAAAVRVPVRSSAGLVTVGGGVIWFSADGIDWQSTGQAAQQLFNTSAGMYAADGTRLYASVDGGVSWSFASVPDQRSVTASRVFERSSDGLTIACSDGIFVSEDGGSDWFVIESGWPTGKDGRRAPCIDLLVAGDDVLAATSGSGLYRTTTQQLNAELDALAIPTPPPAPAPSGGGAPFALSLLLGAGMLFPRLRGR
jgi:hypothetical protein